VGLYFWTATNRPSRGASWSIIAPPFIRPDGNGKIVLRYRPVLLIDAIWQQFAREVAGIIRCARCPAPNCGRWFLRSAGHSDRQYCSPTCRMRVWRPL
jgi:hypothetical protein